MAIQRMSFLFKIVVFSVALVMLAACSDDDASTEGSDRDDTATARYKVTLTTTWTTADFPTNFPGGAHFTALIGGTHSDQVIFWMPGQIASNGIESMAETGSKSALAAEVEAAKADGKAEFLLMTSGNIGAAATEELIFDINETFPLVTLVTMVAPSPDWFIGVHGLSLLDNTTGEFKQIVTVNLKAYDAGTEDGEGFSLANAETLPKQPIDLLNRIVAADHDFVDGISVGGDFIATMTFERIN